MLSRPPTPNHEINLVAVDLPKLKVDELRLEQLKDPDVAKIISSFENPDVDATEFKRWTERGYIMDNGVLYRFVPELDEEQAQLVVPKGQIPRILEEYHDSPLSGHYGIERTYQRIAARYFWPGMRRTIADHVAKCIDCQRYKASNLKPAGQLQTPVQAQRFEIVSIDLFGPLPDTQDGFRWIFIVEDNATRWVELFPLKIASAEQCARCLIDEVILRYGVPRRVVSDNGVQFVSAVMQQVSHCLGFKQSLIPAYHPPSNPVERKNRDLKVQLSILVHNDHTDWKDKLPAIRFAMNTVKSQATGYSAAYLTFGRELRTPDDVSRDLRAIVENDNFVNQITPYLRSIAVTLRDARDTHEQEQDRNKKYADRKLRPAPQYTTGDKVLVHSHTLSNTKKACTSKFTPKRDGPYVITKVVTPTTFEVASPHNLQQPVGKYHASALTPFKSDSSEDPAPVRPIRKRGRPGTTKCCNHKDLESEPDSDSSMPDLGVEPHNDDLPDDDSPNNDLPQESQVDRSRMSTRRPIVKPRCHCC